LNDLRIFNGFSHPQARLPTPKPQAIAQPAQNAH